MPFEQLASKEAPYLVAAMKAKFRYPEGFQMTQKQFDDALVETMLDSARPAPDKGKKKGNK